MSAKNSAYKFFSAQVKQLIRHRGGWAAVAAQLQTTTRTLERTVNNQSRNGRLQRDILTFLRCAPEDVGSFASPDVQQQHSVPLSPKKSKHSPVSASVSSSSTRQRGDRPSALAAAARE